MESEKVKEIKKVLEQNTKTCLIYDFGENTDCKVFQCKDILTYINELESENETLLGSVKTLVGSFCDQQSLKDRIAELEKENQKYHEVANDCQKIAFMGGVCDTKLALKQFAERLIEKFNDTEYRAKTKRKTISVKKLNAQMDWILHEVVIKLIDETLKEVV